MGVRSRLHDLGLASARDALFVAELWTEYEAQLMAQVRLHAMVVGEHAPCRHALPLVPRLYHLTLLLQRTLDFDALLLRCVELLRDIPSVTTALAAEFKHLLVDEFQVSRFLLLGCPCLFSPSLAGALYLSFSLLVSGIAVTQLFRSSFLCFPWVGHESAAIPAGAMSCQRAVVPFAQRVRRGRPRSARTHNCLVLHVELYCLASLVRMFRPMHLLVAASRSKEHRILCRIVSGRRHGVI